MYTKRPAISLTLIILLLSSLTACANSPASKNLEQTFAADPKLKDNSVTFGQNPANTNRQNTTQAELPADFPREIPRYPNAQLQEVTSTESTTNTRWFSPDSADKIQAFYQQQFQNNNWQIVNQPSQQTGNLEARLNDLKVTVAAVPTQNPGVTEFTLQYVKETPQTTAATTPENNVTASPTTEATPEVAATPTPQETSAPDATILTGTPLTFSDVNKAPKELQPYVTELGELGVLTPAKTAGKTDSNSTVFEPNKVITKREFARWLMAANNQIQANQPAKQIRLANESSQPAFQDVTRTDPDFAAIQGLAEAGIIPSQLSGDNTALLFRPDAPLTREQMILWKVPLDTKLTTSGATFDAIKQTWGFQDTFKIDPKAIKALLTDFQNGDASNIRRVYGYTTLFQPKKPVTRAEAAGTIWFFGTPSEGISAKEALKVKNQANSTQN
ncbi:S-layer homology domain-containing protein [Aerosakkonemataceae cyanobacterium BLCC-F50]|uniref:S-layer homology domain-containing protein n=1 Tax=Floridaenema flaviceps BLCC-F50 TaxID=3153642 RepID=A0ABV4XXA3_9CYAN